MGELRKAADGQERAYIFTHKILDISYNKDRVRGALLLCVRTTHEHAWGELAMACL